MSRASASKRESLPPRVQRLLKMLGLPGKISTDRSEKKKILTLTITKMAHNSSWSRCRPSMRKVQLLSEHSNKVQIFNLSSSEMFSMWHSFFSRAPISRYTYSRGRRGRNGVKQDKSNMWKRRCLDTNSCISYTDSALRSCQCARGHFYKLHFFCTVFPFIDTQADFRKKQEQKGQKTVFLPLLVCDFIS